MKYRVIVSFIFLIYLVINAQQSGIYIDPNKSDPTLRRSMVINANQVETDITNFGTVGRANASPIGGVWPRGTGHDHIFEMTGFIAAKVVDIYGNEVHLISDGYTDGGGTDNKMDPITNILYNFHPLPGYFNSEQGQDEIANSLNPESWPYVWPGHEGTFDGGWNGYFGFNQFNADQEVVYVMDDVWDKEYNFYPYNNDSTRRGIGLQIETRLFQWSHPLAKDIVFQHFQVSNAGDHNYDVEKDSIFFGGYGDIGMGGRGTIDDDAAFKRDLNMVYGWDHNGTPVNDWKYRDIPPGYMGWKFLESPGIDQDEKDNDNDGIIDEKRDNPAGIKIVGQNEIMAYVQAHYDVDKFEKFYGPIEKRPAYKKGVWFTGDEDMDWDYTIDDVGSDGADSLTEGYKGPDPDGTEGNGVPDQGEPNFGKVDKDESDQIGLTSFTAPLYGAVKISEEDDMWLRIMPGYFTVPQQNVNQIWIFGSGPFNLFSRETERFSTCWVFGLNEKSLLQNATVAQKIYDSNYKFARPPLQPTLKAVAEDGKVILTWDNISEKSRDPIYGMDFEGYRLYKSTDPNFLDPIEITDMYGNPTFKKPIVQYDLIDGLKGEHPLSFGEEIGNPTGIHFYMGDDTGLKHYYIDTDVINGRTYYYALTAYDKGWDFDFYQHGWSDDSLLFPVTPSECPAAIIKNNGIITRVDRNCAIVTPQPNNSNIIPGSCDSGEITNATGLATGSLSVEVLTSKLLKNAKYMVTFKSRTNEHTDLEYETISYSVINTTNDDTVALNYPVPEDLLTHNYKRYWIQEFPEEGFVLKFNNQFPDKDSINKYSGWSDGCESNIDFYISTDSIFEPLSFVIEIADSGEIVDTAFLTDRVRDTLKLVPVSFKVYEYKTNRPLDFRFSERFRYINGRIDPAEKITILKKEHVKSDNKFLSTWYIQFRRPRRYFEDGTYEELPDSEIVWPKAGDKFYVFNRIPFSEIDTFYINSKKDSLLTSANSNILNKVRVVPNPYVVSSILEQQSSFRGRGERFIRFINLPARCTIRIYTINGDLVRKLEHNSAVDGSGVERWDLLTKDGLEVSFGLYIYHIEAPGIGSKVGKFAIIN